jgi:hypothetical protein
MGFRDDQRAQQLEWRRRTLPHVQGRGWWQKRQYDHILPRGHREENLWPGIRSAGQFPLADYLAENDIQAHTGRDNLLSSWTLASNLYFPFGRDPDGRRLVSGFLRANVDQAIASVRAVELEWEHADAHLKPSVLLGENDGGRGTHQTSPDVAFEVTLDDGSEGVVLTEVKFTEHSFYSCSVRKTLSPSEKNATCHDLCSLRRHPEKLCAQHVVKDRRYWGHLKSCFAWDAPLRWCPAATAGYQLFRQQALAEALAQQSELALVVSSLAYDERNGGLPEARSGLVKSLARTGIDDVRHGWGRLFSGTAKFKVFSHQAWVQFVRDAPDRPMWCDGRTGWLAYVGDRYEL